MLTLSATNQKIELETGAALSTDWTVSYADRDADEFSRGSNQGNVSTATTTDISGSPASGYQRVIGQLTVTNRSAVTAQTIRIKKDVAGTDYHLTGEITLQPGESLHYSSATGFEFIGTSASSGSGVNDGDKGDITVSGGVWSIDAGVVGTTELGDDITSAGKAILDDADASAQRTTLGLGTAATQSSGSFAAASHSHAASDTTSGVFATARLGTGTANSSTFLRGDGTWDTPAGGSGTKTYARFTPLDNCPPATNYATLDTRNAIPVLDFDAGTDESAVFVSVVPEAASLGSGLKVRIHWMATSATSGDVVWGAQIERMNTDEDSDGFDTVATATGTANGTSGIITMTEITITTIDSVAAGEAYRLKVYRDADSGSDTMTGDAELVIVEVRSAA